MADECTFIQAGAGAVTRTCQDKMRENATIQDFGGVGDGVTNNVMALLNAKAAGIKRLRFPAGTYVMSGAAGVDVSNMVIEGDGVATVIDCTACTAPYPIYGGGSLGDLPGLASNASKGDWTLSLASAPALTEGDVFIIFNATDSSWSGHRTYYHAGEFCEVLAVSGTTVTVRGPLYDSYAPADVALYKINSASVELRNLKVIGGASSTGLIRVELSVDPALHNLQVHGANNSGVSFDRCFRPTMHNCIVRNTGEGSSVSPYGLAFGNSQHGRVFGGDYYSKWTGIDMGGSDVVGAVPCRDIVIDGAIIRNDFTSYNIHAANMHGNAEGCGYINCTIYGGVGLAGADGFLRGGTVFAQKRGLAVDINEILGGLFYVGAGVALVSTADPFPSSKGFIDVGGNSQEISSSTTRPLTVKVNGVSLKGSAVTPGVTSVVKMTNNGTSVPINVEIEDLTLDLPAPMIILSLVRGSGTAFSNAIIVDRVACAQSGTKLFNAGAGDYLNFPMRMQRQSGVYSGTTAATSSVISGPINYPLVYPRSPASHITLSGVAGAALSKLGGRVGVTQAYQTAPAYIRPMVQSTDSLAFTAGESFELRWTAGINEC